MKTTKTLKDVEKTILYAADILKENALALAHDVESRKVSGISIWVGLDAGEVPSIEIKKRLLFDLTLKKQEQCI